MKRLARGLSAFVLLTAAYVGYEKGFAVLAARLGRRPAAEARGRASIRRGKPADTTREATELAVRAFGKGHWAADPELTLRYYSTEHGFYMYAGSSIREKDGKRLTCSPFAAVWASRDRKKLNTLTSRKAVVDFDQPTGFTKPGAKSGKIIQARVEEDVRVRDDKGTADPEDDLVIGPLTYLEYVEKGRRTDGAIGPQIRSDSETVIREPGLSAVSPLGFRLDLRTSDPAADQAAGEQGAMAGFNGVETARLVGDVRVILEDVGDQGILPGGGPNRKSDPSKKSVENKTPLVVTSDGPMTILFPEPRPPLKWGPPAPPDPIQIEFVRNVLVERGARKPDRLLSDDLWLTMVEGEPKPAEPRIPASKTADPEKTARTEDRETAGGDDGLSKLTLRRARADGHAVWLVSPAQGFTVRCNELIHEKYDDGRPDKTILLANSGRKLKLEKKDYEPAEALPTNERNASTERTKLKSITDIETVAATIYQDPAKLKPPLVVAVGPGTLETRPDRGKPITQTADWRDRLVLKTEGEGTKARKVILLTGAPGLGVPGKFDLKARDLIKIWLLPDPDDQDKKSRAAAEPVALGSTDAGKVESLEARGAVRMVALNADEPTAETDPRSKSPKPPPTKPKPTSQKTLEARDLLVVVFDPPPPPPKTTDEPTASSPAAARNVARTEPVEEPQAEPTPKEPEPNVDLRAAYVWAKMRQAPKPKPAAPLGKKAGEAETAPQLVEARLEGEVAMHQDPNPGKERGTDVNGDRARVINRDEGRSLFVVEGTLDRPAEVANDDFVIQGPRIHLDQAADYAWVKGKGKLIQRKVENPPADNDPAAVEINAEDLVSKPDDDGTPKLKGPLVITWDGDPETGVGMEFFGKGMAYHKRRKDGSPGPAEARFLGNVEAATDDSRVYCEEMLATLDRSVSFGKAGGPLAAAKPKNAKDADDPNQPKLAFVRCLENVDIFNRKLEPVTRELIEMQRVSGEHVTFDRLSNRFEVLGAGLTRLYNHPGQDPAGGLNGAFPGGARRERGEPARLKNAASNGAGADPSKSARTDDGLVLTRIRFNDHMEGSFTVPATKDAPAGPRIATFYGGVDVVRGKVADENADLDQVAPEVLFRRRPEAMMVHGKVLRVESRPFPGRKDKDGKTLVRNFMTADWNAVARTRDAVIQGDRINYDSRDDLFFVYGLQGRRVTIARQERFGQVPTISRGESLVYDNKTGATELRRPESFQLIAGDTGKRIGNAASDDPYPKKEKLKRRNVNIPGQSDVDRKGFNGS